MKIKKRKPPKHSEHGKQLLSFVEVLKKDIQSIEAEMYHHRNMALLAKQKLRETEKRKRLTERQIIKDEKYSWQ